MNSQHRRLPPLLAGSVWRRVTLVLVAKTARQGRFDCRISAKPDKQEARVMFAQALSGCFPLPSRGPGHGAGCL